MPKPPPRQPRKAAPARATPRKASPAKGATRRPHVARAGPAPVPQQVPPGPSPAELLARARGQLDALLQQAWARARLEPSPSATARLALVPARPAGRTRLKAHWHVVSLAHLERGLAVSLRAPEGEGPPAWLGAVLALLEGTPTALPGQVLPLVTPLTSGAEATLTALALGEDPHLRLARPGDVSPLRVVTAVGISADEEKLVREWNPAALLEVLAAVEPLLLTDPDRLSLLASPRARMEIDRRVEREGSSLEALYVPGVRVEGEAGAVVWRLPAGGADGVVSLLKGRTAHLRPFTVRSEEAQVLVLPAEAPGAQPGPGGLTLKLSQVAARQLRAVLRPRAGQYRVESLPGLVVAVA